MAEESLKALDDQITIRMTTDMRDRVNKFSNPVTHGKPSDVARVLLELGLRAAERHGYHNVLGVIERDVPVEFTAPTLQKLITPIPKKTASDEPVTITPKETPAAGKAKKTGTG